MPLTVLGECPLRRFEILVLKGGEEYTKDPKNVCPTCIFSKDIGKKLDDICQCPSNLTMQAHAKLMRAFKREHGRLDPAGSKQDYWDYVEEHYKNL